MDKQELEEFIAVAEKEYKDNAAKLETAQREVDKFQSIGSALRKKISTLKAELTWGLHVGDIIEWDGGEKRVFDGRYDWKGHKVNIGIVAMKITSFTEYSVTGLMLKKDGTVGLREHTIWNMDKNNWKRRA